MEKMILCDAQTSGGLLIALPETEADDLVAGLKHCGVQNASLIGNFSAGEGKIIIERARL